MPHAWSESLAIDGSQIDYQHRQLLDTIDDLADAVGDPARLAEVLSFLRMYADVHFGDEERAMQIAGYPDLARHRVLHADFRASIDRLGAACASGEQEAALRLGAFLETWLINHIRGADRDYAPWIKALREPENG